MSEYLTSKTLRSIPSWKVASRTTTGLAVAMLATAAMMTAERIMMVTKSFEAVMKIPEVKMPIIKLEMLGKLRVRVKSETDEQKAGTSKGLYQIQQRGHECIQHLFCRSCPSVFAATRVSMSTESRRCKFGIGPRW